MSDVSPQEAVTLDAIISAWNSHDPARLAACFAPDGTFEEVPMGTPIHGHVALQTFFAGIFAAFPDLVMTAGKNCEQGDSLVWEWIITGTQEGEFNGIPASGRPVQLRGVSYCILRGGKIAEDREYWDLMTALQQLGAA